MWMDVDGWVMRACVFQETKKTPSDSVRYEGRRNDAFLASIKYSIVIGVSSHVHMGVQ